MLCFITVTLYDADKVDVLNGRTGSFTTTILPTTVTPKRLYIVVMPCLCGPQSCGEKRDNDGVTFPDDVTSYQRADCEIWSVENDL